ncbi:non-ribosomal peptide synthetase [Nocardia crassostreae]|uniref:non-ribosomal peptide synthetase n=1 Tax=Nocardia crassostreae TaxID=53428 RepID=UPI0008300FD5|nr:non-ribosomal peptide synthetase [Nocardia crassostreae]
METVCTTLDLTRAQLGQWLAVPPADGSAGTVALCVEIKGLVYARLLERACTDEFTAAGTGLIRFGERDGIPFQWLADTIGSPLRSVDLTADPDPVDAAHRWMRRDHTAPLAMIDNPLTSLALLKVGAEHYFWYMRSHHAVLDGVGGLGLATRIAERYSALVAGREPAPYRGLSVGDLLELENRYRASDRFRSDRDYWSGRLGELRRPSSAAAAESGRPELRAHGALPAELCTRLETLAAEARTSIARLLVAALCAFEAAMTGERAGVFSLATARRTTAALRSSGGMLANLVPIGLDCGFPLTRDELIRSATAEVTTALRHSRYRYEDIRRDAGAAQGDRDIFGPTVDLMFFDTTLRFGETQGTVEILTAGRTEGLHIDIYRTGPDAPIAVNLIGNADLYTESDIRRRLDRLLHFLTEFLTLPGGTPLGRINLLGPDERRQVLRLGTGDALTDRRRPNACTETDPGAVSAATLAAMFTARTAACPDAVALRYAGESLSYGEFAREVHRLARYLIAHGVGPGTVVGVAMTRSMDLLTGMYAVLMAGGAYLPVDPALPAERIAYMTETARPGCVLTTARDRVRTELPAALRTVEIDRLALRDFADSPIDDTERIAPLRPDDLAYVIFTSGSTGRPKGVMVTHASITAQLGWFQTEYPVEPADVMLHKTPITFDVSIWELLWPILSGARLVIAEPDGHADPLYLAALIASERVTLAHFVPAVLGAFLAETDPASYPTLRQVFCSGEALPPDLAARLRDRDIAVHNLYGPTEATIHVTFHPVGDADTELVPIGAPVADTRAFVLDAWLRPVPSRVPGELYLSGIQLARGYAERPGLTADRFVANPFDHDQRMYRTGDLVRWGASGALEYLGRTDFQVKIHGVRIEPGEIEAVLSAHAAVDRAVVIAHRPDRDRDAQLIGYVLPGARGLGGAPLPDALREYAADRLPPYMVPAHIVELDEWPVTANGKLNRAALPAPAAERVAYRTPSGPVEEALCAVFADVLGIDRVGADDDFFALGGDSILSTRVVARARARGLAFTPRDVLEQRTAAALALVTSEGGGAATLPEITGGGVGEMALGPVARWLMDLGGSIDRFHLSVLVRLPRGIDRAGLTATLQAVLDRHDMLRARLCRNGTEARPDWRLIAAPTGSVAADSLLRRVPVDDDATPLGEVWESAVAELNPHTGAVLRAVWLDGGPDRPGRLLLVAHHLVLDGVSSRIVIEELASAWSQVAAGTAPTLDPGGTSMRTWTHTLETEARSPARIAELPMWQSMLDGPDPLPGLRPLDPAVDVTSRSCRVHAGVDPQVTAAILGEVPAALNTEIGEVLMATLGVAVAQWHRRHNREIPSVLLRLVGHGREEQIAGADLSRTVGWFNSMFPIRVDLSGIDLTAAAAGGPELATVVASVRHLLHAIPDKGLGYALLRYLNPDTAAHLPADMPGQICFNYLGQIRTGTDTSAPWTQITDSFYESMPDPALTVAAPLDITAIVLDGHLVTELRFPDTLLNPTDIQDLANTWTTVLSATARSLTATAMEVPRAG